MKNTEQHLIFGFTWDEIRNAQQGPFAARLNPSPSQRLLKKTFLLLEQYGVEGLYEKELWGVIDRLGLPLEKPK
jgi:hypothetical protein